MYEKLNGLYAPHTESGLIVVDGILFSTYSSIHNHNLAHIFFKWYDNYRTNSYDETVPSHFENLISEIARNCF